MSVLRVPDPADAEVLADLWATNREHLDPWSPERNAEFYTVEGQLDLLERRLAAMVQGRGAYFVVLDGDRVVGEINLNDLVRGAFQNAHVGYWLAADVQGRGLMTRAVEEITTHAFDVLRLHRLQAATLAHNERSQAVLRRAGFESFGRAPRYLKIGGQWQDHVLFHRFTPHDV